MHDDTVDKLLHKDALHQLEWDLKNKFDFSEILADALMKRIQLFIEENHSDDLGIGQIPYWGVCSNEPSGKPMDDMEKDRVKLTFHQSDDHKVLREQGIKALRQSKIMRMTIEAKDQGILLTQEDLSLLLCCTTRTIRNDIRELRDFGITVPTRGQIKDIGKGVSHKAKIVEDYLKGYEFSDIKRRTHHSEDSIDRYIRDFLRVIYLTDQGESLLKIRMVTRISERLIQEYQDLYETYSKGDCPRLRDLLSRPSFNPKKRNGGNIA
jgi:biotin operon repressor